MKKVVQIRSKQLDVIENNRSHKISVEAILFIQEEPTYNWRITFYLLNSQIVEYLLITSKRLIELNSGGRKSELSFQKNEYRKWQHLIS